MRHKVVTMGDSTVKHITPDSPEFATICKEITPIERVKHPNLKSVNTWDDGPLAKPKTRPETPDKLRG